MVKLKAMKLRARRLHSAIRLNDRDIKKSMYKSRAVRLSSGVQQSIKFKHYWTDKYNELMLTIAFLEGKISEDYYTDI